MTGAMTSEDRNNLHAYFKKLEDTGSVAVIALVVTQ